MNIPSGATHFYNTSLYSAPMKKDGDDWFLFEDKRWIKVDSCNYQLMREKITPITPKETISHPTNYTQGKVECIDAIESATVGKNGFEAYCVGNVIKYLWRYEEKGGKESVEKAQWYLNKLLEQMK